MRLDLLDPLDNVVKTELAANKENKVKLDHPDLLDPLDHLDPRVHVERSENLDSLDLLDHQARPDSLDLKAHKVRRFSTIQLKYEYMYMNPDKVVSLAQSV